MEANECLLSHGKRLQQRRRAAGSFYRWVAVAVGVGFNNTGSGPLKDVYFQCILSGGTAARVATKVGRKVSDGSYLPSEHD